MKKILLIAAVMMMAILEVGAQDVKKKNQKTNKQKIEAQKVEKQKIETNIPVEQQDTVKKIDIYKEFELNSFADAKPIINVSMVNMLDTFFLEAPIARKIPISLVLS